MSESDSKARLRRNHNISAIATVIAGETERACQLPWIRSSLSLSDRKSAQASRFCAGLRSR